VASDQKLEAGSFENEVTYNNLCVLSLTGRMVLSLERLTGTPTASWSWGHGVGHS